MRCYELLFTQRSVTGGWSSGAPITFHAHHSNVDFEKCVFQHIFGNISGATVAIWVKFCKSRIWPKRQISAYYLRPNKRTVPNKRTPWQIGRYMEKHPLITVHPLTT